MTWRYQVVRTCFGGDVHYEIAEVYALAGHQAWCEASPGGSSIEELRRDLERMLRALDEPAIAAEDLPRGRG